MAKKQTFDFYLDEKVTTWMRTKFEVGAKNKTEAKKKAIEMYLKGELDLLGWDEVEEVKERMSVIDNDGMSTAELYDEDGNGDYFYANADNK